MSASSPGALKKRSVMIAGHRTSVSLEEAFWDALRDLAVRRRVAIQSLIAEIDAGRQGQNLSSAIRVHVLKAFRDDECPQAARPQAERSSFESAAATRHVA